MNVLLAAVMLSGVSDTPEAPRIESFASHQEMVKVVAAEARTGTLLFSEGDCLAVRIYSGSPFTHVAAICFENGKPMVYDSANGYGVRRQTLEDYLKYLAPDELHMLQPTFRFTTKLTIPYRKKLKQELGRPYSVKHHLSGERCEGLHCAEYVTDALMASDIIRANNPAKVSPASLLKGVRQTELYQESMTLKLIVARPPEEKSDSWCGRLWIETRVCTSNFCAAFRRKVLCRE